jgi:hypothetical protein
VVTQDPARAAINRAIRDATERADRARGAVVRMLCGDLSWHNERVTTAREEMRRALSDRAVARELLRELDEVDGVSGKPGSGASG